mmetsp:Transcript_107096/g.238992  ORF Transcript_107096/g.238992 Transcript_107096/m.238992 type:complete len:349 (-) Transcript_107096:366-1412(-)
MPALIDFHELAQQRAPGEILGRHEGQGTVTESRVGRHGRRGIDPRHVAGHANVEIGLEGPPLDRWHGPIEGRARRQESRTTLSKGAACLYIPGGFREEAVELCLGSCDKGLIVVAALGRQIVQAGTVLAQEEHPTHGLGLKAETAAAAHPLGLEVYVRDERPLRKQDQWPWHSMCIPRARRIQGAFRALHSQIRRRYHCQGLVALSRNVDGDTVARPTGDMRKGNAGASGGGIRSPDETVHNLVQGAITTAGDDTIEVTDRYVTNDARRVAHVVCLPHVELSARRLQHRARVCLEGIRGVASTGLRVHDAKQPPRRTTIRVDATAAPPASVIDGARPLHSGCLAACTT